MWNLRKLFRHDKRFKENEFICGIQLYISRKIDVLLHEQGDNNLLTWSAMGTRERYSQILQILHV